MSGVVGGMTMGLTAIAVGSVAGRLGDSEGARTIALLFYPVGFIAVIIGRAQLFTEQTLYPVLLLLKEKRHLLNVARIWGIVLSANVVGAILFSLLVTKTSALPVATEHAIVRLGADAVAGSAGHFFWSGIFGGWLIALVAWMVTASHRTIGQLLVIWLLTFVVGVGHFAHSVATSCEILVGVFDHSVSLGSFVGWFWAAVAGNSVGGVVIVSLLNYGQVEHELE
jgi:formate/nitrite transporter FocA (FNT family)